MVKFLKQFQKERAGAEAEAEVQAEAVGLRPKKT